MQLKSKVNFLTPAELKHIPLPALIEIEGIWWEGGIANIRQQTIDVINPTSDKSLTFPYQDSQNTPIKFKVLLVTKKIN